MISTVPVQIERELTLKILRGQYPAGSRLPTVRALAAGFRVNQATIQRVVARLETRGLVSARQGSGLTVNDPHEGDLGLLPFWIEAMLDERARAVSLLDGFLEVRRVVAARLLVRHRELLLARLDEMAEAASALVASAQSGPDAFRAADLAMTKRIVASMGNPVALTVVNTLGKLLDQVPLVASAMYAEPQANLGSWLEVMTALRRGGDDMGDIVERAIADIDRRTVARFEAVLAEAGAR